MELIKVSLSIEWVWLTVVDSDLVGSANKREGAESNKPTKQEKGILQKLKDVFWTSDEKQEDKS